MKELLIQLVRDFCSSHLKQKKPILIGYSGGVDSTALLSLFFECRFLCCLDIHVAHFDHGWREKSREEASYLASKVVDMGLSFHSKRCKGVVWGAIANKEDKARELRYQFFKEIYNKIDAQALLLGHQREDASETVLKRILEGAAVFSLGGMQEISQKEGMVIGRPLIRTPRKKLIEWNAMKGLIPLEDITNEDLHFLRPRLRYKVFPYLERWFGKGVQKNLASLGEEFYLLKEYMQKKIEGLLPSVLEGPFGFALLEEHFGGVDPIERQELIRYCLQKRGVSIGREGLQRIETLLAKEVFDKKIDVSLGELIVNGPNIFWIDNAQVKITTEQASSFSSLLEGALKGCFVYRLDGHSGDVFFYSDLDKKEREKLSSFFARNKIPATMRRFFPCVKKPVEGFFLPLLKFNQDEFISEENKNILMIKLKKIT